MRLRCAWQTGTRSIDARGAGIGPAALGMRDVPPGPLVGVDLLGAVNMAVGVALGVGPGDEPADPVADVAVDEPIKITLDRVTHARGNRERSTCPVSHEAPSERPDGRRG